MKKISSIVAVLILSSACYAGVAKFSFNHVVKPVAHVSKVAVSDTAKGAVKTAKVTKKVLY